MNSLQQLVTAESWDARAVFEFCIANGLISDNCSNLESVAECDAGKAVQAIRETRQTFAK